MIGSYVFQIKQCLTKIAGMSTKEVLTHYGFSEELAARNLKTRATGGCMRCIYGQPVRTAKIYVMYCALSGQ